MPAKPKKRHNECLDMGAGMVTLSRNHLFAIVRDAIEAALADGVNVPEAARKANAAGRASQYVQELIHGRKP